MTARRRWQDWLPLRDARHYVFLDESGITTDLLRRYGRSPRGRAQTARSPDRDRTRRRTAAIPAPYSPDFNPIELAFATLKAFLRAARPRTFDHVVALMAMALELFTPQECANFVRHCGYRVATGL